MKKEKICIILSFNYMQSIALVYVKDQKDPSLTYCYEAEEFFENLGITFSTGSLYSDIYECVTDIFQASVRYDEIKAKINAKKIIEEVKVIKNKISKFKTNYEIELRDYITNTFKNYL